MFALRVWGGGFGWRMFEEVSGAFMVLFFFALRGVGECKKVHLFVLRGWGGFGQLMLEERLGAFMAWIFSL